MVNIRENIPLAPHTVFKIGGPARYFCETASAGELAEAVSWSLEKKLRFFILGAGSNVLVSDKGFDGLVIKNKASDIKIDSSKIWAEAGTQMARVVAESVKAGLTGFEWAIGIPGTIGGSIRGNAGCFGSEMRDVVQNVTVLEYPISNIQHPISKITELSNEQCQFGYRDSIFKHNPNLIVLSATLSLKAGDPKESQKLIGEYAKKRASTQDIGEKCAGCIFKNVEWSRKDINKPTFIERFPELKQFSDKSNIPAAFLIDQLGLKETKIGGAEISRRHANYFINTGEATAEDVLMLAGLTKERVQNRYGILLEKEIQLLV